MDPGRVTSQVFSRCHFDSILSSGKFSSWSDPTALPRNIIFGSMIFLSNYSLMPVTIQNKMDVSNITRNETWEVRCPESTFTVIEPDCTCFFFTKRVFCGTNHFLWMRLTCVSNLDSCKVTTGVTWCEVHRIIFRIYYYWMLALCPKISTTCTCYVNDLKPHIFFAWSPGAVPHQILK